MFEKEIKFAYDFCLNKISKAGASLTFERLKGIEIHPAILNYISAEIDYNIYKDRQTLLQKSAFDYSGSKISKYYKLISNEIKKSKTISETEILDLLKNAVTFNFNFTTKPNTTLSNLIFKDTDRRSSDDLNMLFEFTYYYPYLVQILKAYIDKKQLITIEREEFNFILEKIDSEILPLKMHEVIEEAANSIADFFNFGAVVRSQIPAQALEIFLKEKKLDEYVLKIEKAVSESSKIKFDVDEIKKIIFSKQEIPKHETEAPKYDFPPVPDEKLFEQHETEVTKNLLDELPESSSSANISKDDLINNNEKVEIEDLELINPNAEETVDLSEEITIEEETETFSADVEELEEGLREKSILSSESEIKNKKDIISYLSDRDITKISSVIFNDDKEDFALTLESISECQTYEKATEILKNLYTTYEINPYSREAILLTNAVAKYFTEV